MPRHDASELVMLLGSDRDSDMRRGFKLLWEEIGPEVRRHIKLALPGRESDPARRVLLAKAARAIVRAVPLIIESPDVWLTARWAAFVLTHLLVEELTQIDGYNPSRPDEED